MRLSAFVAFAAALTSVAASDVIDLTTGSFSKEIMSEDLALVEFFAPWCGHCKNLAPHYEEAATELKSTKGIKLAKVDCTAEQDLCSEYGVTGYPTLKVFRNGVPTDYAGPRKADGIVSYMIKRSLPAVTEVTPESHDEFIKMDRVVLVAYGKVPKAFEEYANTARDTYLFGHYSSSSLPKIPTSPSAPAIVLYKSFDEGYAVLPASEISKLDAASLGDFVKTNSIPLFDEIGPENFGSYAEQGLPIAYLFVDPEAEAEREKLVSELSPLAKEMRGQINFVWIDGIKFKDHGKSLGVSGDLPAFVVQDLAGQLKYVYNGKINAADIGAFTGKVANGEIQPTIKSQPVPKTQTEPVYQLTADGWDQLFDDDSKDVFAEFYAPWCGHCQRLAPVWETLGERYAKSSNIVIAQMDATENDIPPQAPFRVQGFPTLKFRPAGSDVFIDYNGDRSLESLIEFIESTRVSERDDLEARGEEGEEYEEVEIEDDDEEEEDHGHAHDEL